MQSLSCVQLLATPWTAAYQAPPPIGFSRQEYWSGVPLPSPRVPLETLNSDSYNVNDLYIHHTYHSYQNQEINFTVILLSKLETLFEFYQFSL